MKLKLHDYQKRAVKMLLRLDDAGLFLDMGLGKSAITLTALDDLMFDQFEIATALIIAPKSVAQDTWQAECRKWDNFKHFRFSTVMGTKSQRIKALKRDADCYVINRDNVVWLCQYFKFRLPYDVLIIDESSSFKDSSTKRFRALRKARGSFKRRILLTGTPRPKSLLDLWAQLYLLDGGTRLGKTLGEYQRAYFVPDKRNRDIIYSYKPRDRNAEIEIYKKIGNICMSMLAKDYLQLPPVVYNQVVVNLSTKEKKIYDTLERDLTITIAEEEITAATAAVLTTKLLQLSNGNIYSEDGSIVHIHDRKLDALADIVEQGNNMLVFYSFKHDAAAIRKKFGGMVVDLHGADEVQDWNAGKIRLLLAHPASCAYGLNMQAGGNTIVWYGLTQSLELYMQANARIYRQGQQHAVIIHHIMTKDTWDFIVWESLQRKEKGQSYLMDAIKQKVLTTK